MKVGLLVEKDKGEHLAQGGEGFDLLLLSREPRISIPYIPQ